MTKAKPSKEAFTPKLMLIVFIAISALSCLAKEHGSIFKLVTILAEANDGKY